MLVAVLATDSRRHKAIPETAHQIQGFPNYRHTAGKASACASRLIHVRVFGLCLPWYSITIEPAAARH